MKMKTEIGVMMHLQAKNAKRLPANYEKLSEKHRTDSPFKLLKRTQAMVKQSANNVNKLRVEAEQKNRKIKNLSIPSTNNGG